MIPKHKTQNDEQSILSLWYVCNTQQVVQQCIQRETRRENYISIRISDDGFSMPSSIPQNARQILFLLHSILLKWNQSWKHKHVNVKSICTYKQVAHTINISLSRFKSLCFALYFRLKYIMYLVSAIHSPPICSLFFSGKNASTEAIDKHVYSNNKQLCSSGDLKLEYLWQCYVQERYLPYLCKVRVSDVFQNELPFINVVT